MNETKNIHLTNFNLTKRQTIKGDDYFVIFDQETNTAYFCFANKLKDGDYLQVNGADLTALEIEFTPSEKGNKVLNLRDTSRVIF